MVRIVVLSCPACGSTDMIQNGGKISCKDCGAVFAMIRKAEPSVPRPEHPADRLVPSDQKSFADNTSQDTGYGRHVRSSAQPQAVRPQERIPDPPAGFRQEAAYPYQQRMDLGSRQQRPEQSRYQPAPSRDRSEENGRNNVRLPGYSSRYSEEDRRQDEYHEKALRAALLSLLGALLIILVLLIVTEFKKEVIWLVLIIGFCAGGLSFLLWMLIWHSKNNAPEEDSRNRTYKY